MEITPSAIQAVIFESIKELNEQLAPEQHLKATPETELLGASGTLDSLSFVNFVAIVEEKLQARFGVMIVLSGEPIASGGRDPFANVATLVEYIALAANGNVSAWK